MTKPHIPHTRNTFVEASPPFKILHVVTDLMDKPSSPGFDAEAHAEMMRAIGPLVGERVAKILITIKSARQTIRDAPKWHTNYRQEGVTLNLASSRVCRAIAACSAPSARSARSVLP